MKTIVVEGQPRTDLGKSSTKKLRKEGLIPCVVYKNGEEPVHFSTETLAVRDLIYTDEMRKASLKVGDQAFEAIIKEVQYHPVTDKILHIDFHGLVDGVAIKTELPIKLVGTAKGQKVGGTLVQKMRKLKVKVTPEGLRSFIEADVTPLTMGKSMRVRDIKTVEGIEFMSNGSIPIASVEIPRALRSAQAKAAAEAAQEEA
jgi:large subunit ribosomal protein L25